MERRLNIATGLSLPIDLITESNGILGKKGSGKTTAGVDLAEEIHAAESRSSQSIRRATGTASEVQRHWESRGYRIWKDGANPEEADIEQLAIEAPIPAIEAAHA